MISAVDGVIIRRERLKGRAKPAALVERVGAGQNARGSNRSVPREVLEFEHKAPDMVQTMDILDRLSAELVKAGTVAEVIDQCVVACRALFPSAIMLHWDGQGNSGSACRALDHATERLTDAVERGTLDIFTPCGGHTRTCWAPPAGGLGADERTDCHRHRLGGRRCAVPALWRRCWCRGCAGSPCDIMSSRWRRGCGQLILGAGQAGETLAQRMVTELSDVTLVDRDRQRLDQVVEHLDVSHLTGNAASPELLKRAGD